MRARGRIAGRAVLVALSLVVLLPVSARAAAPAPSEPCVAGTVWEDPASGVKYLCVYDELYGGTRWELMSSGQRGREGFTYRSSANGCVFNTVGLSQVSGGGGNSLVRSFRWPCTSGSTRSYQPPGEIRVRTLLQRYGSTWTTCRDSGYAYNATTAWTLVGGIDMGGAPDCGPGLYRTWGHGQVLQGGAWHGSYFVTPSLWLD
jgi:hypothetical protein